MSLSELFFEFSNKTKLHTEEITDENKTKTK